ncbi:MAG: ferritin-like domain-containing protein [Candidatus Lambdaproteobacteria bacterium]|nr:ferritin-like domain-containing protein [Candidatus Lambdaproteobacteria bacterium]
MDTSQMYPYLTGILQRAGKQVQLGGVVKENQVFDSAETSVFNWDYAVTNPRMRQLYERAKTAQWNTADLPWDTAVDLESNVFDIDPAWASSDWFRKMSRKEQARLSIAYNTNQISQFVHGEHGALLAAAQLVDAVPDIDSKLYAASQTFDEARHVEVFYRYARDKLGAMYDCTQNLFNLMQAITIESRWDFKFLGMQLIIEGLAIAAFANLLTRCNEPLFRSLMQLVLRDEARHVAFGVIALNDYYSRMNEAQRRERQEFVYEACVLMRGRLFSGEAYERMGVNPEQIKETMRQSDEVRDFRANLFSQIVPNMRKVGLLDGWLAERFAEMDVLHFKDYDADAVLESLILGQGIKREKSQAV